METILNSNDQILTILGTDKGKSLLYIFLSQLLSANIIMVILLLITLKQNIIQQNKELEIPYQI